MRKMCLAFTVIFLAPTAVMALTSGRELVGDSELGAAGAATQKSQIAIGGVAANGQRGLLGGNVILAKGDKSGTGPGAGGHKGQKKGGHHGGQKEGHDKNKS
jgi:hypothetical protein